MVNYNVFYYLMAFLREVLQHSDKNKLQSDKLGKLRKSSWLHTFIRKLIVFLNAALLFSSVLVRSPNPRNVSEVNQERKKEFVHQFLSSKERLKVP